MRITFFSVGETVELENRKKRKSDIDKEFEGSQTFIEEFNYLYVWKKDFLLYFVKEIKKRLKI